MRVVQVNKFHFLKGGAERYYLDLSAALRRSGIEVQHLAMSHPRNLPAAPGDAFVREVDYRSGSGFLSRAREGARTLYNREAARKARRLAAAGPRPVAHLHNIYHQLSPSVILALARAGIPMVQTLHDYKLVCPAYLLMTGGEVCERCRSGRYYQAVRHRCLLESAGASLVGAAEAYLHRLLGTYGHIARFLCPSRFLLEKVASFGISRQRLIHLPYFLPLERYRPAEGPAPRDGDGQLTCLYVGRLSREKGIATLITAMGRIPPAKLKLDVLGEGPLRAELEERARAMPGARIRFLGYRQGEDLFEVIRRSAFCLVPSEWYENLPYSILEPFALGRPVVGARIGGIPELVRDGRTGHLFESGSAGSLAETLLWMAGPEADLGGMGATARRIMMDDYSERPHIDRLISIYDEVAA